MGKRYLIILGSFIIMAPMIMSAKGAPFKCPDTIQVNSPFTIANGMWNGKSCKNVRYNNATLSVTAKTENGLTLSGTYLTGKAPQWEYWHVNNGNGTCSLQTWINLSSLTSNSHGGTCQYYVHSCSFSGGGSECPTPPGTITLSPKT